MDLMVLVFAVRRLLDLDDHHVHPACPEAGRGTESESVGFVW
jgi:hypothetical protein